MEGKRVLAPEKDIQEVRNAILAYEKLPGWRAWELNDLLNAHRLLMAGLVDNPGHLRRGDVGIYRGSQLVHMAPPAAQLQRLVSDLLGWLKQTDLHPLIASSVFHYEFEFIHPFSDGNGRMGRLWQTLILSHWRAELGWLPVETLIHFQQTRYYQILGECDRASDCTLFVEFMLQNIAASLREALDMPNTMSDSVSDKMSEKERAILELLTVQPQMSAAMLASMLGVTSRTVERYLSTLQAQGKLIRTGARNGGSWRVVR